MALMSLRDVVKHYPSARKGGGPIRAIDGVSLDIEAGDIYGIIGYSGAGKSTLVRLINALERVSSGSIEIDGTDITTLPEPKLRAVRGGIGMIFQQFNLFNSRNVAGNVAYPLRVAKWPKADREQRVGELLDWVGLSDRARNYPDQLSGGQKQRVGIARALSTKPRILLADEATSALDPQTTEDVLGLLRRANEEFGVTIIVITHEMDVVKSICSHVAVMEEGHIVERGEVFDVFSSPQSPATRRFVSTVVQTVPSAQELAELRSRHDGRLVSVGVKSGETNQAEIFRRFGDADVDVELVYGGITEISGKSFGQLTFSLSGNAEDIDRAIAGVREIAEVADTERLVDELATPDKRTGNRIGSAGDHPPESDGTPGMGLGPGAL
ncbi:methionine import ATP-binding protein MetN [Pseudoclavibacter endophyticus]|uniref:Methionine ABC transporter ATP-binding protein n=1 Tax=Pseudoclavibacter endophyticus TaxID=1778590 RepID=A0A6H9WCQ7_9MICO|nr:methionine ABC transporter ATP-binding protein [Pseudoclavibacter endophyticus]KAB1648752.1 methionine ABC transporter ATP-binding protein [Pseudoclavibacter endophyticus]GGA68827.1 methionine import ATP-binding protein MetN [Pseudoclavibacter endophyticus]